MFATSMRKVALLKAEDSRAQRLPYETHEGSCENFAPQGDKTPSDAAREVRNSLQSISCVGKGVNYVENWAQT